VEGFGIGAIGVETKERGYCTRDRSLKPATPPTPPPPSLLIMQSALILRLPVTVRVRHPT